MINPAQHRLMLGESLREGGLDSVEANNQSWIERIRAVARQISMASGSVSADDLRKWADKHNDQPGHVNAWGSVFRGAGWVVVGRVKSTTPTCHAREIKVWRWVPELRRVA